MIRISSADDSEVGHEQSNKTYFRKGDYRLSRLLFCENAVLLRGYVHIDRELKRYLNGFCVLACPAVFLLLPFPFKL